MQPIGGNHGLQDVAVPMLRIAFKIADCTACSHESTKGAEACSCKDSFFNGRQQRNGDLKTLHIARWAWHRNSAQMHVHPAAARAAWLQPVDAAFSQ